MDFSVCSFNCKGLKSSYGLIDNILNDNNCDLLFVSEHWLTTHELSGFNSQLIDNNKWTHMKSSIDPEEILTGRPHGGIGFIANRVPGISYKPLIVDSDRISGVQLIASGRIILMVFGVYLPYFNGRSEQIDLLCETLDILQSAIDNMDSSPIMVVGDMNASLPHSSQLNKFWFRKNPFTKHSYIL